MTSQVVRGELDIANSEFFRSRMKGRLERGQSVILQHVQESRFACAPLFNTDLRGQL